MQEPFSVHGIFLRRYGGEGTDGYVVVEVDTGGGKWVEVIRDYIDSNFSHIVEPNGIRECVKGSRGVRT